MQYEKTMVDVARYRRLLVDHEKEETNRLEAIYDAFTTAFKMTRDELIDELCNWTGNLLDYYEYCNEFKFTTLTENRKRGRPRKLALTK